MKCKSCDNTIEDTAFIGGLCIDCYSGTLEAPRSMVGNLARKAVEGSRKALEARRDRRGYRGGPEDA